MRNGAFDPAAHAADAASAPRAGEASAARLIPECSPRGAAWPSGSELPPGLDPSVGRSGDGAGEAAAARGLAGIRVLLVDDEPELRLSTVRVLQEAGAEVLAAANAEEALVLLRSRRPTVLLSDIGMPRVDGYELIRRVRRLPAASGGATPAAALTAFALPEDRQRALTAGYQLHLVKPVAPEDLVLAIIELQRHAGLSRGR